MKYMNRFVILILLGCAFCVNAVDQDHFRQILHQYEKLSGKHVEMIDDIDRFAYQVNVDPKDQNLTAIQIEEALRKENIGLYEITTNRLVVTWIEPNIDMTRWHLNRYKKAGMSPPITLFGFGEIREYQAKVPKLRALREQFDQANEAQLFVAMQDVEYRAELNLYESLPKKSIEALRKHKIVMMPIVKRLLRESEEYRAVKNKRDESLLLLNISTFEFIIDDYEKRGKCVPTRWMNKPLKKREEQKAVTHQHSAGCRH